MASRLSQLSSGLGHIGALEAANQPGGASGGAVNYNNPTVPFLGTPANSTLANVGAGFSGAGLGSLGNIITGIATMEDPLKLNFGPIGKNPTASGLYSNAGGTTYGAPATAYNPNFGGIPGVPGTSASENQAIMGDISNLGGLYGLASGTTGINAATAAQPLIANLPDYENMLNTGSTDILSNLSGNISPGTINQLEQVNAERGVGAGLGVTDPNSPAGYGSNQNAALDQALGLTSEQLQQQGLQELGGAISTTPVGAAFDAGSFNTSPDTQLSTDYLANQLAAAPIPTDAAAFQLQELLDELQAGVGGGGGGGSGGGGGGGGGGILDSLMGGGGGGIGAIAGLFG